MASPTSPHYRVKRERRALQPLFPSNAADILAKGTSEEESPTRSPEGVIAEAAEGEEHDSASVSGSDYSHEEDGDSDADDGRSNFGLGDDTESPGQTLNIPTGGLQDDEDEGDVTMRLRELSRTPSAETPNKERRASKVAQNKDEKPEPSKKDTNDEEEYLSELSEDEAFAASLA